MATIEITFTHPQASYSKTFNVADADLVRVVQAAKDIFYRPRNDTRNGPVGDASPLTNQQALERVALSFWGDLRRITKDYEVKMAMQAAAAAIPPISEG
jgi:hypothetical protein